MKIGVIVPFAWSYPSGVAEHTENDVDALRLHGHDVRLVHLHEPIPGFTEGAGPGVVRVVPPCDSASLETIDERVAK